MKKLTKILGIVLSLTLFALMAMGSGSSSEGDSEDGFTSSSGSKETISIEEQVLLDQDGVVITAKEYAVDGFWGDGIKLELQNNTSQNLTIGCSALIVNDYHISDLFSESVAAGKKAMSTMYLSSSELKEAGITNVGQVEIYFHIYDSDSWDKYLDSDVVTLKTSAFEAMDTTPDDMGQELYNENGIRIVGKAVDKDSFWGTSLLVYIENNSGQNVTITMDNMSINDYMVDPMFYATVYNGKKAIETATVFDSELKENGIENVEKMEFSFHISQADNWSTITNTPTITLTVN